MEYKLDSTCARLQWQHHVDPAPAVWKSRCQRRRCRKTWRCETESPREIVTVNITVVTEIWNIADNCRSTTGVTDWTWEQQVSCDIARRLGVAHTMKYLTSPCRVHLAYNRVILSDHYLTLILIAERLLVLWGFQSGPVPQAPENDFVFLFFVCFVFV